MLILPFGPPVFLIDYGYPAALKQRDDLAAFCGRQGNFWIPVPTKYQEFSRRRKAIVPLSCYP